MTRAAWFSHLFIVAVIVLAAATHLATPLVTVLFAYFVLQQIGLALGTGGQLPPWLAAWAPNLAFGTAGIVMTARVR